ncbi:Stp1/IreP family PP2C-type Ser/Thr phosphatase [Aquibacillus sediminis]|uniref:Stp1/IreP family PP2C-type Ser/Thr phosphatase n=1 Tax=Aquibacillus sediminis TaxID=2574734 RepID=UPI0011098650|nr:Stp1/IreP family PP2C-type Ser/Thr phosphatase [Aquibacillus sediminis]
MDAYFLTDQGRVRNHNEDAGGVFKNANHQILVVIADGMGGHQAGDVASNMVIEGLNKKWETTNFFTSPDEAEAWLLDAIMETNNSIYHHAQNHEECKGMGTTIVAAICTADFISIGHIGDSRCYLYNEQGFKQVTEDHSLVNELVRNGQISKEDAEYHPRKNVLLKALGTELDSRPDIQTIGWDKGDTLVLCSDGLSNKLETEELKTSIKEMDTIQGTLQSLVNKANERGGEDNISVALVQYRDSQEVGES